MSHEQPKSPLRVQILKLLIVLSVFPLLLVTGYFVFLFEDVIKTHAMTQKESLSFELRNNLKRIDHKVLQNLNSLYLNEGFQSQLKQKESIKKFKFDEDVIFDRIALYDHQGEVIEELKMQNFFQENKKRIKSLWEKEFFIPKNSFEGKQSSRGNFQIDNRLDARSMARKISSQNEWSFWEIYQDIESGKKILTLSAFRSVITDTSKVKYIEVNCFIDSEKWSMLAGDKNNFAVFTNTQDDVALFDKRKFKQTENLDFIREIFIKEKGRPYYTLDDNFVFFDPLNGSSGKSLGHLMYFVSAKYLYGVKNSIVLSIVSISLFILGVVVFFSFYYSEKLSRPMKELLLAAESVREGRWARPMKSESALEMDLLVKRFNEMAQNVMNYRKMLESKILELAKNHEELIRTQEHLVLSEKMSSLGVLVSGVAHELNNPISYIYSNMLNIKKSIKDIKTMLTYIDDLESKLEKKNLKAISKTLNHIDVSWIHEFEDMIDSSIGGTVRIKDIVLGLKTFSHSMEQEFKPLHLSQLVEKTLAFVPLKNTPDIKLHLDLDQGAIIEGNQGQIAQVILNLMQNAVQALKGQGNIWLKVFAHDQHVKFSIRDDGEGISSDNLSKIFYPFFTTKNVGEGTGLGLSIVHGILQKHKATITVKSLLFPDENHGTEFLIDFQQVKSTENVA